MNKSKKIYSILNIAFTIFVSSISLLYLTYVIFYQEREVEVGDDGERISVNIAYLKNFLVNNFSEDPQRLLFLLFALLLSPFNLGCEVFKWRMLMGKILTVDLKKAIKSILGGVAASTITPFRIGGYFARVALIPKNHRPRGAAIILLGDISQYITTVTLGAIFLFTLIWRSNENLQFFEHQKNTLLIAVGSGIIIIISYCLVFINMGKFLNLLDKIPLLKRMKRIYSVVSKLNHRKMVLQLFLVNLIRLSIIIMQYLLVFKVFGLNINLVDTFLMTISTVMLIGFIPVLNIIELGLTRANLFLLLLHAFISPDLLTIQTTIIVSCSLFTIWLINTALPSLTGSYFLAQIKLIKRK